MKKSAVKWVRSMLPQEPSTDSIKGHEGSDNTPSTPVISVAELTHMLMEEPPELRHPYQNQRHPKFAPRVGFTPPSSPAASPRDRDGKKLFRPPSDYSLGFTDSPPRGTEQTAGSTLTISPRASNGSGFSTGITSPSSFASLPTTASLLSLCKSPQVSPNRETAAPFPVLTDNPTAIHLLPIRYTPLDNEDAFATVDPSLGEDAEKVAKLPIEHLDRMYLASHSYVQPEWQEPGSLISFRIQPADYKPNRRQSLIINGKVIACPKSPPASSRCSDYASITAGHRPRDAKFMTDKYIPTDDNIAGAFCEELRTVSNDAQLLAQYQKFMSANIVEVRLFEEVLVCFSERRNRQQSYKNGADETTYAPIPGEYCIKHYMQECRTIQSILELIDTGVCKFESAANGFVYFKERNLNHCVIDLRKFIPKLPISFDITTITSLELLRDFNNILLSLEQHYSDDTSFHCPIFYVQDDLHLPVMCQTGVNGYFDTCDADPYINSYRQDVPPLFKTFNGLKDDPELFITGLKILVARLACPTQVSYKCYIEHLKQTLRDKPHVIEAFKYAFSFRDVEYWFDYNEIEFYRQHFIDAAKDTLSYYTKRPERLKTVGQSNVIDLVIHYAFAHPLYVHGTESFHPKSQPDDESAMIACYNGSFAIAADPTSFMVLLLCERDLLKYNLIPVHPYWLCSINPHGAKYNELVLDVITIVALNMLLHFDNIDARKHNFNLYWDMLVDSITLGRTTEPEAIARINQRMQNLERFLHRNNFDSDEIQNRIDILYLKYSDEISAAKATLRSDEQADIKPTLST